MHLGPEQGTGTGIHPRPDQSSPHNECPATGAWRRGGEVWGEWESPPPLEMAFSKNTDDSSADVFCWVWPLIDVGKQRPRFRNPLSSEDACGCDSTTVLLLTWKGVSQAST